MSQLDMTPPEWAIQRALDVMGFCITVADVRPWDTHVLNVARYIMQHEQPPVDPLLLEAREVVAGNQGDPDTKTAIREGRWDLGNSVCIALTALRRGIELAEKKNDD